jgi:nucleotide-binding universal stress UspA family protein
MKYILVPTDYSAAADTALRMAAHIARRTTAKLGVLHAWHMPVTLIARNSDFLPEEAIAEMEAEFARQEARLKALLAEDGELETEFLTVQGFAVEVILDAATDRHADLIVMGTTGASGLQEVVLGSNAAEVIRKAKCAVLAVPSAYSFTGIKRVAWCTDWLSSEEQALDQLILFAAHFDATLDVVHVVESEFYNAGEDPNQLKQEISNAINYAKVEVHLLANPDVNKALESYFDTSKPDVVAMMMRRRGFVDRLLHLSKTRRMAMHSAFPILAFHE